MTQGVIMGVISVYLEGRKSLCGYKEFLKYVVTMKELYYQSTLQKGIVFILRT